VVIRKQRHIKVREERLDDKREKEWRPTRKEGENGENTLLI